MWVICSCILSISLILIPGFFPDLPSYGKVLLESTGIQISLLIAGFFVFLYQDLYVEK